MQGPKNAIIGSDFDQLPETTISEDQLAEIRKTARFSKTAEFKVLKDYIDRRIDFYQKYLPDGRSVAVGGSDLRQSMNGMSMEELGTMWVASNVIIGEMEALINQYEQAAEFVKNESTQRKRA